SSQVSLPAVAVGRATTVRTQPTATVTPAATARHSNPRRPPIATRPLQRAPRRTQPLSGTTGLQPTPPPPTPRLHPQRVRTQPLTPPTSSNRPLQLGTSPNGRPGRSQPIGLGAQC